LHRFERDIDFDLAEPFRPFEQLMGVLPSDSCHALPKGYRWLMTDPESPIIDFYPKDIPVDPNGKAMPWLWVVLLPFIDEERLLGGINPIEKTLTDDEKKRNRRNGDTFLFMHSANPQLKVLMDDLETATVESPLCLKPAQHGGFSGKIVLSEEAGYPLHLRVAAPKLPPRALQDVPNNQVTAKNSNQSIDNRFSEISD
jgi:5'-3' exoribonuclease 2